jgi:hypothetical protein
VIPGEKKSSDEGFERLLCGFGERTGGIRDNGGMYPELASVPPEDSGLVELSGNGNGLFTGKHDGKARFPVAAIGGDALCWNDQAAAIAQPLTQRLGPAPVGGLIGSLSSWVIRREHGKRLVEADGGQGSAILRRNGSAQIDPDRFAGVKFQQGIGIGVPGRIVWCLHDLCAGSADRGQPCG